MNQITVEMNALGYTGDYEEQEERLKIKITKDPSGDSLTEKDCLEIIQVMISAVEDTKSLYPEEDDEEEEEAGDEEFLDGNKMVSVIFRISYKGKNKRNVKLSEEAFFQEAAQYDALADAFLAYTNVTAIGDEGQRIMMPENEAYESHPSGTFAMLSLVMRDKKWIPEYIRFLKTNDLDHEMMQMWQIQSIMEKYGWCRETTQLAIARNVSCCGQGGKEQFETFVKGGLFEYIAEPANRQVFLDDIRKEFLSWDNFSFRLKDGSEEYYVSNVVSFAHHFKGLLSKEEVKETEKFLKEQWENYSSK